VRILSAGVVELKDAQGKCFKANSSKLKPYIMGEEYVGTVVTYLADFGN